jgi:hypothetical protein
MLAHQLFSGINVARTHGRNNLTMFLQRFLRAPFA